MPVKTITHEVDFCIVGGGLAGLCAAVSAARNGCKVALMQERPVLGGNASSEIRMWVSGAHGENNRETGLLEEIMMENQLRNPDKNYSIWDSVLYQKAIEEKNLLLLLNCSCMDACMQGDTIASVTGWQMTTQQFHVVKAAVFADCSGDSILAPLTDAPYREGREGRDEFGELIAPAVQDQNTMGLSCLLQAEETNASCSFIPPPFAEKLTQEQLIHRAPDLSKVTENFWYLELGGTRDTIEESEKITRELQALAYGMWGYLKNDPAQKAKNSHWKLLWVGALAGRRESRRYIGAYTMTENDILNKGVFQDEVAFGGWTMDDHHPDGFRTTERPNIFHPAPSPYGIPFGCLYSRKVKNLMFAGRNISVTHAALSSTRVMGTCALLGQAVGTAAALCIREGCMPCDVACQHMKRLQQKLLFDDCYLPHVKRECLSVTKNAFLEGEGENLHALRDGFDRPLLDEQHAWLAKPLDQAIYTFASPQYIQGIRLVFDSDLNRDSLPKNERMLKRNMFHNKLLSNEPSYVPKTMVMQYRVMARFSDRSERVVLLETLNYNRLRIHTLGLEDCVALTLQILKTWGNDRVNVFSFEAY